MLQVDTGQKQFKHFDLLDINHSKIAVSDFHSTGSLSLFFLNTEWEIILSTGSSKLEVESTTHSWCY